VNSLIEINFSPFEHEDVISCQSEASTTQSSPDVSLEVVQVAKTGRKRPRKEFIETPTNAECIDIDEESIKVEPVLGPVQPPRDLASFFTLTQHGSLSHITFPLLKQLTIQSKLETKQSVPLLLTEKMHQQHLRGCLFNEHPIAQIEGVGGLS